MSYYLHFTFLAANLSILDWLLEKGKKVSMIVQACIPALWEAEDGEF